MKKLGVIRLFICLAAIITELLPLGAVLKYGLMSDNGHLIFRFENYSYFDVTPFGYAMFHYMICAVTTTITAMLSLLWIFFGKKRQTPISASVFCGHLILAAVTRCFPPLLLRCRLYRTL